MSDRKHAHLHTCWAVCFAICIGRSLSTQLLTGGSGWALRFDGQDDFVTLTANMPPPPKTIEFWAEPQSLSDSNGAIVSFNSRGSILSRASMNTGANWFLINYNGAEVWHSSTVADGIQSAEVVPTQSTVGLYHYAYVQDVFNFSVYINGILAATQPLVPEDHIEDAALMPWLLGARAVYIGGKLIVDDRCFGGVIDEMRWWKVARTQEEIFATMHMTALYDHPDLEGRWGFDAGIGLGDGATHALGGGDSSRAPDWIPSPVKGHGGPVAFSARIGTPTEVSICGTLVPPVEGALMTAAFDPAALHTWSLSVDVYESFSLLQVESTKAEEQRFCKSVIYTPTQLVDLPASDTVPYTIRAQLPNGTTITEQQVLAVRIIGANTPPVAGMAMALQTNGRDNYVSLGVWPAFDEWSMSVWVKPLSLVEDSYIVSRHLSNGRNIFFLGFYSGDYYLRVDCVPGPRGCWRNGVNTSAVVGRSFFPVEADDELVLGTGKTGLQIRDGRAKAQHIAVTFRCITRGSATEDARAEVKMFVDGVLIGSSSTFEACFTYYEDSPLSSEEGYVPDRPTPWEMGQEYDGGSAIGDHQDNVKVVPSNFFNGIFDEFHFWDAALTDVQVVLSAIGGVPEASQLRAHYNFDLDDAADCAERQLWDSTLQCFDVNEVQGRTGAGFPFQWTNARINRVQRVRSPFSLVAGSPIHVTVESGTCASRTLEASDADGDDLSFHLIEMGLASGNVTLVGDIITFCDFGNAGQRTDEVRYDVCDTFGLCSSASSGLGVVKLHILTKGPEIVKLSFLPNQGRVRIAFSEATNTPAVASNVDIARLLDLPSALQAVVGSWEAGGQFLRLTLLHPQTVFQALQSCSNTGCSQLTTRVKREGLLRDKGKTQFPSTSVSPAMDVLVCANGTLLVEGEPECRPCEVGLVPETTGISTVCVACRPGYFQSGSDCLRCPSGQWSDVVGASACEDCEVLGAVTDPGAQVAAECHCSAGEYEPVRSGNETLGCIACPPGMECAKNSRAVNFFRKPNQMLGTHPMVMLGHMSRMEDPTRVFQCRHDRPCPGGVPGTCDRNHDPASVACGGCKEDYFQDSADSCASCEASQSILIMGLAIFFGVAGICIVAYAVGLDRITETGAGAGCALVGGLTFTAMQSLAVFEKLMLNWHQPVKGVLAAFAVISFDVDFLRVSCILGHDPVVHFMAMCSVVPLGTCAITLTICLKRLFVHSSTLPLLDQIINGVGSIFLIFYLTVVITAVRPFVCFKHPSGGSSVWSEPSILCFSSDERHAQMLAIGVIVLLVLVLPYSAVVVWGSLMYPRFFGVSGTAGLRRFNFLYRRFTPSCYYFCIVILARGLGLCLVPAVIHDEPALHIMVFTVILISYWFVLSMTSPWRTTLANTFDLAITGILLLLLVVGSVGGELDAEPEVFVWAGWMFVSVICPLAIGAAMYALYLWLKPGLMYHRFICHDKCDAAAQARCIHMMLVAKSNKPCLIDTDHLADLDALFDIIKTRVRVMVVYLTKDTLRRPWCAGEVVVAHRSRVPTLTVMTPQFVTPPPADWQDPYATYLDCPHDDLIQAGVTADDLCRAFMTLVSGSVGEVRLNDLLVHSERLPDIAEKVLKATLRLPQQPPKIVPGSIVISSNPDNMEATATACILSMFICEQAVDLVRSGVFLLADHPGHNIETHNYTIVLVLLSGGTLHSVAQVKTMMQLKIYNTPCVLINDPHFSFPKGEYYTNDLPLILHNERIDVRLGVEYIQALFRTIALPFKSSATMTLIRAQANVIIERMNARAEGGYTGSSLKDFMPSPLAARTAAVSAAGSMLSGSPSGRYSVVHPVISARSTMRSKSSKVSAAGGASQNTLTGRFSEPNVDPTMGDQRSSRTDSSAAGATANFSSSSPTATDAANSVRGTASVNQVLTFDF